MPAGEEVLLDGGALEELDVLERACDALLHDPVPRQLRDLDVAQHDRPLVGIEHARDHVEHGGLARAVRADDREDLLLGHVERQVADRADATEAERDALAREQAHRYRSERM